MTLTFDLESCCSILAQRHTIWEILTCHVAVLVKASLYLSGMGWLMQVCASVQHSSISSVLKLSAFNRLKPVVMDVESLLENELILCCIMCFADQFVGATVKKKASDLSTASCYFETQTPARDGDCQGYPTVGQEFTDVLSTTEQLHAARQYVRRQHQQPRSLWDGHRLWQNGTHYHKSPTLPGVQHRGCSCVYPWGGGG